MKRSIFSAQLVSICLYAFPEMISRTASFHCLSNSPRVTQQCLETTKPQDVFVIGLASLTVAMTVRALQYLIDYAYWSWAMASSKQGCRKSLDIFHSKPQHFEGSRMKTRGSGSYRRLSPPSVCLRYLIGIRFFSVTSLGMTNCLLSNTLEGLNIDVTETIMPILWKVSLPPRVRKLWLKLSALCCM